MNPGGLSPPGRGRGRREQGEQGPPMRRTRSKRRALPPRCSPGAHLSNLRRGPRKDARPSSAPSPSPTPDFTGQIYSTGRPLAAEGGRPPARGGRRRRSSAEGGGGAPQRRGGGRGQRLTRCRKTVASTRQTSPKTAPQIWWSQASSSATVSPFSLGPSNGSPLTTRETEPRAQPPALPRERSPARNMLHIFCGSLLRPSAA
mmetsp:Transcript_38892/g.92132  ORF Transcript_38892/g.92132 Transcript_38892/m.92132 type:complete len:202 (-) Transcript_38892:33-638(-)